MFLDTSFCIDLMREWKRKKSGPATTKLRSMGDVPLYVSIFVLCELQAGARMSSHPDSELQKVEMFSEFVEVVLPDRSLAISYGEAEAFLRKKGTPVSTMDLLIGVTAKIYGMPLLTDNKTDFMKIPGLVIETY